MLKTASRFRHKIIRILKNQNSSLLSLFNRLKEVDFSFLKGKMTIMNVAWYFEKGTRNWEWMIGARAGQAWYAKMSFEIWKKFLSPYPSWIKRRGRRSSVKMELEVVLGKVIQKVAGSLVTWQFHELFQVGRTRCSCCSRPVEFHPSKRQMSSL